MAYSDKVIDHYENPRNVGTLDKEDPNVGTGLVGAPACGDVMRLQLKISDEGIIQDAKFKTFGCGSAIASSSLVTEWVKGRSVDDATRITNKDIAQAALIEALATRRIAGAGTDVTADEPMAPSSPLWAMEQVLITPHTAGETRRYEDNVIEILLDNLGRLWRGDVQLRNQIV